MEATKEKYGGPAFPGDVNQVYVHIDKGEPTQPGMSLRDYFVAKVMQGFCANSSIFMTNPMNGAPHLNIDKAALAEYAVEVADAALAAREPKP